MNKEHGNNGNQHAKKEFPLDSSLTLRAKSSEKAAWIRKAEKEGESLQNFVRNTLNRASKL